MAMIECPNCMMQISDKAKKCVHCGTIFILEEKSLCIECGAELEEGASICSKCGCPAKVEPIAPNYETFQQTGTLKIDAMKKPKGIKLLVCVIVLLLLTITAAILTMQYQQKKTAEKYAQNLDLAMSTMLSGADIAGSCCAFIDHVWFNAIYQRTDNATDKYTQSDGEFVSDFNKALENLFADSNFYDRINSLMENQEKVRSIIQELENPSEEYTDACEAVLKIYDAYLTLTDMAINPTGSLQTFSSDFDAADAEFASYCQTAKIDISQYQENRETEKALRRSREYAENLRYAMNMIISGAADSENCCNLIVQVWNHAIWQKKDTATDKYTRPNGYFVSDFNDALENLFADPDFQTQINAITENQETVNSIIGKLKNPPEEYKAAYDTLADCYRAYRTFTNMAINPTGSLTSFSEDFNTADTELMLYYHDMEFYLQEQ